MNLTTGYVAGLVDGLRKKGDVVKMLKENDIRFEDVSADSGYDNIRIPTNDGGYIRVYRGKRTDQFKVQKFEMVEFKWSGIPTFEPSGRRSF